MCPECGSSHVRVTPYDYGVNQDTGYHDAGERFACLDCGAAGDADDLAVQEPHCGPNASIGTSWAGGGALPSSPSFPAPQP
jgi:hypothetical protein